MKKKCILCVDDEKIVLESLRSELSGKIPEEYVLEFAEGGFEALEVIAELLAEGDQLALIITDYLMPGLKGDEVLAKIYAEYPVSRQIMLTGQANVEGIANAINNAKLYRYIAKPWEKNDLLLTIREAIKSYEQEMQLKEHQKILEETVKARTRELEKAIEDLKNSQEQLVISEKMAVLGSLVAGIAHEINTPVGVGVTAASHLESRIREIVRLTRDDELTREAYEDFLENAMEGSQIILRNLKTAANLVSSFKQVAIDQASETLRSFNLREYIDAILLSLQPELKPTRIRVEVDCPEDLTLESYPGDFSQIFTNLIMNSITHGFNQGRDAGNIVIKIDIEGKDTVIRYKDDGKGIPGEIATKIFDPFFTTNRQSGGSGLGMHIIYNIVTQKYKGSISCTESTEKGACFVIRIPVAEKRS